MADSDTGKLMMHTADVKGIVQKRTAWEHEVPALYLVMGICSLKLDQWQF